MFVICSYHEPAPRGYNILCSRTQRDTSLAAFGDLIASWQVYLGAQQVVQTAKTEVDNSEAKTADQLQKLKSDFDGALETLRRHTVTPEQTQAVQLQLDQMRQAIRDLESRIPSASGAQNRPKTRDLKP